MRFALRRVSVVVLGLGVALYANSLSAQTQTAKSKTSSSSKAHGTTKKTSRKKKDKGQMAPTSDRITEIQQALAKDGSYSAAPSGKWDGSTVDAMKKFQTTHALNPTGKLDALTLEKLGLGSTTAGVAEPVAPPNSTSRLTGGSLQSSRQ
ncbi:MAG TPA: peptidoglycan-binding domain-containing protein [Candidatus Sulfotelmatobacter sp.]|nr:peptidoglycan-binding domain-containing protein [Candidatus Sulfotelmatobacter sp.]